MSAIIKPTRTWKELSYLVATGGKVAHVAKHGRASVYAIGKTPHEPDQPELGEVLCGVRPDWWAVATLDLVGFGTDAYPDYEECQRCMGFFFDTQARLNLERGT